jgi:hypothetical protein
MAVADIEAAHAASPASNRDRKASPMTTARDRRS